MFLLSFTTEPYQHSPWNVIWSWGGKLLVQIPLNINPCSHWHMTSCRECPLTFQKYTTFALHTRNICLQLWALYRQHLWCKEVADKCSMGCVRVCFTLMPLVSSSSKEPMSKASAAFTSPLGGIKGGEYYRRRERTQRWFSERCSKEEIDGDKGGWRRNGRVWAEQGDSPTAAGTLLD